MMKKLLPYFLSTLIVIPLLAFHGSEPGDVAPAALFSDVEGNWARETLAGMTLDEKIGQLFMIATYSNKDQGHVNAITNEIVKNGIGGLIFMQGDPDSQIKLANHYQEKAKYPLLISQDAEWGLSMRLQNTVKFPRNMTLGAINDNRVIEELGMEIGYTCRRVGVQMDFAPVVDVNNNPDNPVINDRSFGELRENVAAKGIAIHKGMWKSGVLACAKHFPGHGDTDVDSHKDLPVINHSRERLDSIEMYPFRKMIDAGIPSIMIAHLDIPSLDNTKNLPTTLSPKVVTELLKNELGFQGLIITDALSMKGVTKYYETGEADLKAFLAGNDILLFSENVSKAKALIKTAVEEGEISEEDLNKRVLKILTAKEWAGLHIDPMVSNEPAEKDILRPEAYALKRKLYEKAITLASDPGNIIPLQDLSNRRIALVKVGGSETTTLADHLNIYTSVEDFYLPSIASKEVRASLISKLKTFNTVIVAVDGMNKYSSKNFGVTFSTKELLKYLNAGEQEVITVVLGSPYSLKYFGEEDAVLVTYENEEDAQIAASEAIFGAIPIDGKLPVSASEKFPAGVGISRKSLDRFAFGLPEAVGMDGNILAKVDSIAERAINIGATPGCAILVARGDRVVLAKGYGKTEYSGGSPINPRETVYDLASVTKIFATTIATMKLVDEGKIKLNESIAAYVSELRETDKANIQVKNLLMHNAGLRSWIPFYAETFDSTNKKEVSKEVYQGEYNEKFCVPVVNGMFMCVDYQDSMWFKIKDSPLRTDGRVVYSDLGMIIMGRIIENVTGTTLDKYVDSVFYRPMGLSTTRYKPWETGIASACPPTEDDDYWRNEKVQGYVHDQASAMMGGVAGHAGLFSNVYDAAKILYMLKMGGNYGGQEFIKKETINHFTTRQLDDSRKGIGFDKAEMDSNKVSPCSEHSSELTFGHTGFTGIGAWVDPEEDLIFIFLSNRTFPKSSNRKLIREGVRTEIMDVIYESIYAFRDRENAKEKP